MNENTEALRDKVLNAVEIDYSYVTALKDKAESIGKMATLKLDDEELRTFYDNYIKEATILKNKIELKKEL